MSLWTYPSPSSPKDPKGNIFQLGQQLRPCSYDNNWTFDFQADAQYLKGPHITAVDEKGLETAVLGLEFRVANKHFKRGDMKLKCLATIATVYLQSNEESVEGDERILKAPVMESRETRAQSHTRNDLMNGKLPLKSLIWPFSTFHSFSFLISFFLFHFQCLRFNRQRYYGRSAFQEG